MYVFVGGVTGSKLAVKSVDTRFGSTLAECQVDGSYTEVEPRMEPPEPTPVVGSVPPVETKPQTSACLTSTASTLTEMLPTLPLSRRVPALYATAAVAELLSGSEFQLSTA